MNEQLKAIPIVPIPAKTMTGMIDKYGNPIIGGVVENDISSGEDVESTVIGDGRNQQGNDGE